MSDKLWEIAAALHTVIPIDRKSLDTLTGCITLLISMASQQEKEDRKKEDTENGR